MAFKTVFLTAVAFLLVTAKGSYLDEGFKEKAVHSKSVVHASAPAPPMSPTPAPPVVTPSTPIYKPPVKTPPPAPPVKPPTPAPPVHKPPTPPPPTGPPTPLPPVKPPGPAPPAYKPPSPSPPPGPPTPLPPVKPPTTGPMPPPVRTRQDCTPLCDQRCKLHSRKKLCARACMTCCDRCKCVPPGTYGNREKCGKCYTDMTTRRNKPKCP
ncbi:hypothetical protein OIU85_002039 [Salix viminalis]|uniref:Gibberellin-regulated protein 14 n=2 Tax=Salix viminalis TaxID=40686 RepID=A0A9Q0VNQ1_SALVM|nr:hypothetical protein OIU85_002039 [Salix viminalis]